MKLKDKKALITGGMNGIGAATAVELAYHGADICIIDLEAEENLPEIEKNIKATNRTCTVINGDMRNPEEITRCVHQAIAEMNHIDVLVHCAGKRYAGGFLDISPQDWYEAFDMHVHSIFHLCREIIPNMKQRGEGAIVLISSVAGFRGCRGAIAYDVVKGAIPQFVRDLALEFSQDNIRVNAVAPGIIRTRFQNYLTPDKVKNNIENRIPLQREGKSQDVAKAITLLITNDYITGETISIDGGMSMRMV